MKTDDLNPKSVAVLGAIKAFWALHHYSPSVRDIQAMAHISSLSMVDYHLKRLQRKGRITLDPGIARSIVVVKDGE